MSLFVNPFVRALDTSGNPLPAATLTFYKTGSSTPAAVYTSPAQSTAHSNPVTADAAGLFPPIYLDDSETYRVVLKDSGGTTIQDIDPYDPEETPKLSIGTYAEAEATRIPADVKTIQLSDRSGMILKRVATQPAHQARLRSADRFLPDGTSSSTNGGWWEAVRSQPLYVTSLGASGWLPPTSFNVASARYQIALGCPDEHAALQAYFDCVWLHGYRGCGGSPEADRVFGTSVKLFAGPEWQGTAAASLRLLRSQGEWGELTIVALAAIDDDLLEIRNLGNMRWCGKLTVAGSGSSVWSTRINRTGVRFTGWCSGAQFAWIYAAGFAYAGIVLATRNANERLHYMTFGTIQGVHCGSGSINGNPAYDSSMTSSYSGAVYNGGGDPSTNQRTTMSVPVLPPAYVEAEGDTPKQWAVRINNGDRYHHIMEIDRGAGTISVFPRLATADPASGSLEYLFGGLFLESGSDAGQAIIHHLVPTACGIGYNTSSLCAAQIRDFTSQSNGIGILYRAPNHVQRNGSIENAYFENGASWLEVVVPNAATNSNTCRIGAADPATFAKIRAPFAWDGVTEGVFGAGLGAFRVDSINGEAVHGGSARKLSTATYTLFTDGRSRSPYSIRANSATIDLLAFSADLYRLYGVNSAYVEITGTGMRQEPTGTITVRAPTSPAKTVQIEGGVPAATVTIAGSKKPLLLKIEADVATGNFTVRHVLRPAVAAVAAPTGGATVDAECRNAVSTILARLQEAGITA